MSKVILFKRISLFNFSIKSQFLKKYINIRKFYSSLKFFNFVARLFFHKLQEYIRVHFIDTSLTLVSITLSFWPLIP